jgi:hypothetical protein
MDLRRAKVRAPSRVRNEPEIFILTFIIPRSCSARLLVRGTSKSVRKRSVSVLKVFSLTSRLWPGSCLGRPRLQACSKPRASRGPARAIQTYFRSRQNQICRARQPAATSAAPRGPTAARSRPPRNPARYQRVGKRHSRLRDEAENLRRNRPRQRPRRPSVSPRPAPSSNFVSSTTSEPDSPFPDLGSPICRAFVREAAS